MMGFKFSEQLIKFLTDKKNSSKKKKKKKIFFYTFFFFFFYYILIDKAQEENLVSKWDISLIEKIDLERKSSQFCVKYWKKKEGKIVFEEILDFHPAHHLMRERFYQISNRYEKERVRFIPFFLSEMIKVTSMETKKMELKGEYGFKLLLLSSFVVFLKNFFCFTSKWYCKKVCNN